MSADTLSSKAADSAFADEAIALLFYASLDDEDLEKVFGEFLFPARRRVTGRGTERERGHAWGHDQGYSTLSSSNDAPQRALQRFCAPRVVLTRVRKIRLVDKKGALDSMARHIGMFKDVVKLEVKPIRELMDYISNNPAKLPAKP